MASIFLKTRRTAAFRRRAVLSVLLLCFYTFVPRELLAGPAAQGFDSHSANYVEVSARRAGNAILVLLRIKKGYHLNANPASAEYLIPTSIVFEGVEPERIVYPSAIRLKPVFADQPIEVYEGTVTILAIFSPGVLDERLELGFKLTAQACTEQICLPPEDIVAKASW